MDIKTIPTTLYSTTFRPLTLNNFANTNIITDVETIEYPSIPASSTGITSIRVFNWSLEIGAESTPSMKKL